jgi:bilirubin oxidase
MRHTLTLFGTALLGLAAHAQNPLAIPPALDMDTFDLVVDEHVHQFFPGINTNTYGASAEYLGPTLVLHKGDTTNIRVHNQLAQITSMHWHGMHVPGEQDGGPQMVIEPGAQWHYMYAVKNPAGTYWYHPHPHELTAEQANMGVAGFIIVQDDEEAQLELPRTYGVDDFPVVVQDRTFIANGDFAFGPYGNTVLVNGTPDPYLECPAQVVRLRLLNGSNARVYVLGFEDGRNYQVIGGDGGLLAAPATTDRLWLSNGERAEVLLDLSGMEGDSLLLMSYGSELPQTVPGSDNMLWESSALNGIDFPLLRIRVTAPTAQPVTTVPTTLVAQDPPQLAEAVRTRTKTLSGNGMVGMGMFMINGLMFDMEVINDTVQLGSVEVWNIVNNSNMAHPMHIHGVSFTVLERNGVAPPAWEQGPKDVVLVDRLESVKLIMRFTEPAPQEWPYMYHCHNLLHEDNMMMLQYMVRDQTTGIRTEQASGSARISAYPSPTHGQLTVTTTYPAEHLHLVDAMGRTVLRTGLNGARTSTLDLAPLPRGTYVLLVHGDGVVERTLVVRE